MLYQIIFSFFDVESPPTRLYYEFRPTLYLRFNFLFFLFHHALFYLLIKPDALVRFGIFSLSLSLSLSLLHSCAFYRSWDTDARVCRYAFYLNIAPRYVFQIRAHFLPEYVHKNLVLLERLISA